MMRNSPALDSLLSRTTQAILVSLLLERDRPWYLSDLARRLRRTPSTLQRPLESLVDAGILTRSVDGNRVYYAPNAACPFLPELRGLLRKTIGLADVLRDGLAPFAKRLRAAFVYGSVARGEEIPGSDVDLFLLGDVTLADLTPTLRKLEERLGRPVNATIQSPDDFSTKLAGGNHFLRSILANEKMFVLGTNDDLERLSTKRPRRPSRRQQGGARRPARGPQTKPG
jgi:predicted nucleotidyltransferase